MALRKGLNAEIARRFAKPLLCGIVVEHQLDKRSIIKFMQLVDFQRVSIVARPLSNRKDLTIDYD